MTSGHPLSQGLTIQPRLSSYPKFSSSFINHAFRSEMSSIYRYWFLFSRARILLLRSSIVFIRICHSNPHAIFWKNHPFLYFKGFKWWLHTVTFLSDCWFFHRDDFFGLLDRRQVKIFSIGGSLLTKIKITKTTPATRPRRLRSLRASWIASILLLVHTGPLVGHLHVRLDVPDVADHDHPRIPRETGEAPPMPWRQLFTVVSWCEHIWGEM